MYRYLYHHSYDAWVSMELHRSTCRYRPRYRYRRTPQCVKTRSRAITTTTTTNSNVIVAAAAVFLIQHVFSLCSFFAFICLLLSLHIWPELFAFVFDFFYFFAFRFFLCLLWIWLLFVFNVYLHPDLFLAHFSWCLFVCLRVCARVYVCVCVWIVR